MNLNRHSELKDGEHAFIGASKWQWINWDDDKLYQRYLASFKTQIGTLLHSYACDHIRYGVKIQRGDKHEVILHLLKNKIPREAIDINVYFANLMAYVNDAIGFSMEPEVKLKYSDTAFGTADAIFTDDHHTELRIHDYKSGETPAHMEQLLIYAALFCLDNHVKPGDLKSTELRIYQSDDILVMNPTAEDILPYMDKIVRFDKIIKGIS